MYVVASGNRQISLVSIVFDVSPGSDSVDALVSWFCDNSPQSVYKLAKSHSTANTATCRKSWARNLLMCSDLTFGPYFKVK